MLAGLCARHSLSAISEYGAGNIKDAANWVRGAVRTTPRHDS